MNTPNPNPPRPFVRCHVCQKIARTEPLLESSAWTLAIKPEEICVCDRYYHCHLCGKLLADGAGSHVCAGGVFKVVPRRSAEASDHFAV